MSLWYHVALGTSGRYNAGMEPIRPAVAASWLVVVLLVIAPWFTGGREPVAMLVSAFGLLLGWLLVWRNGARQLAFGPVAWSWAGLLIWGLISWLWSASKYSTEVWLLGWLSVGLVFGLAYKLSQIAGWRQRLLAGYLTVAAVFAGVGLLWYVVGDYDRLTSTMYWPNPAAAYLLPALLVSLERFLGSVQRRSLWGNGGLVVLFGTAFALTGSRAAFAVFALVLVFFIALRAMRWQYWIKLLFTLAITVLATILFTAVALWAHADRRPALGGGRITEVVSGQSQSGRDRLEYMRSGLDMWWSQPITGVGAGAFADAHATYQRTVLSASAHPHNYYIEVLAELGLVGGMLLASLLLWLTIGCLKGLLTGNGTTGLFLGWTALLLHFGLDIDAAYPALLALAAVLAAIMYAQWGNVRFGRPHWLSIALVFGLVFGSTMEYQAQAAVARGLVHQANGDYELAVASLAAGCPVVMCDPDTISKEAINRLAWAVDGNLSADRRGQELELALLSAREAGRRDAFDSQHDQLIGRIQERRGDLVAAESAYKRALSKDELNHPEYALDLARLYEQQRRLDEAVGVTQAMLERYPPGVVAGREAKSGIRPALANLAALKGRVAVARGDLAGARAALREARDLDRSVPAVQFLQDRIMELAAQP